MIVVDSESILGEFGALLRETVVPWLEECAGMFLWGFVEPGHTVTTHLMYRQDKSVYLEQGWSLPDEVEEFLLDIPDEVDPDRAELSAVIVTYRVSDGALVARVVFGEEAEEWRPRVFGEWQMAEEMCPL